MLVSIIFSVILIALLASYIVFYAKKSVVLQRIFLPLILPFAIATALALLIQKVPDSTHITVITAFASAGAALHILFKLINLKNKEFLETLCLIISTALWGFAFMSVFWVYQIHPAIHFIFITLYLGFFIFTTISFGFKTSKEVLLFLVPALLSAAFNYFQLITLFYSRTLSSLFCFLGSLSLLAYVSLTFSTRFKASVKHQSLILILLFLASQILSLTGTVLLQYLF